MQACRESTGLRSRFRRGSHKGGCRSRSLPTEARATNPSCRSVNRHPQLFVAPLKKGSRKVMTDRNVPAAVRLRAAESVFDRGIKGNELEDGCSSDGARTSCAANGARVRAADLAKVWKRERLRSKLFSGPSSIHSTRWWAPRRRITSRFQSDGNKPR